MAGGMVLAGASDFILALDIEHWEMKTLPEAAEPAGTFRFSQEETVKYGESAADGRVSFVPVLY